mmetsp:Transcript_45436/g.131129  ORF Transcript_45436/g.131129 Transcript_45436/m.131129 type:complete len:181 (-) Transcript_45436:64-606(-)
MRSLSILLLLISLLFTSAQFGVPNAKDTAAEATIDANGDVDAGENPYAEMATRLQSVAPIDIQDAVDLAAIIQAAQADPDTKELISKLKVEEGEALEALAKEVTAMEIVQGMKQSLDELKAIETLFADPERAVVEMEKEGLIEKKQVEFYKQNPEALADETRRGVYFGFVSMAVAGGYLE